ncbi:MAG: enoyl-CoA hydratase [Solirubrobacterales bacterium]|jgi:acetyl-CoA C-acetyltransferase|nr:enoyl-CoA hydratase [Solirubrobacterales bacterium]
MSLDPRTPVLVGAGQVTHRDGAVPSPVELMATAARAAARDAGAPGLLDRVQSVGVVDVFSWPVPDPAAVLAGALGLHPAETVRTTVGGNGPIALLGDLAARIAAGRLDVALMAGGEAGTAFQAALREGRDPGFATQPDGTAPTRVVGVDRDPGHPAELEAGLIAPIFWYPLFEHAVRGAAGRTREEHQAHLGELWLRFADTARENPHSWATDLPRTAAEIAEPARGNRRVSDPYTKAMNANIAVDQGAALLVCSVAAAQAAGVPADRWVFLEATAGAHDHWLCGERERFDRSPAIAACGAAVLGHAGAGIDDVALLDLYSCFPSAVQVAGTELGVDLLDPARSPTATGGLAFAGGPANNYVTHALATLVGQVRERPEERALSTAVGWYLTKHGAALLSGRPPAQAFTHHDVQPVVDARPRRTIVPAAEAVTGEVEAHTAIFDRDGTATMGIVALRLPDGRRAFARSHDADTIAALQDDEPLGRAASTDGAATFGF